MVATNQEVAAKLRAAYNSIQAAMIMIESAMSTLRELDSESQLACKHVSAVDISTMAPDGKRAFCKECMSYIYPDGRVEPVQ